MVKNKEEETYNNCLSIQVSLDGFSFYTHDDSGRELQLLDQYIAEETLYPEHILKEIKEYSEKHGLDQKSYNNVQVTYFNALYTIIPTDLFDPECLTDYIKYNVKILSTDFLTYDELIDLGLNIVYVPFTNINNYFFDCFGSFTYHHHIGQLLKSELIKSSEHKSSKKMKVNLRSRDFDLVAQEETQLKLINTFNYHTVEDILYHILFCYEQLGFDPNVHELQFLGSINTENTLYKLIHQYVRNITILAENPVLI